MSKNNIGKLLLTITLLVLGCIALSHFTDIIKDISHILYMKFNDTKLYLPVGIYISSIVVIFGFAGAIVTLLLDTNSSLGSYVIKLMLTIITIYIIFIGPVIMLTIMILIDIPIKQITIVFAVLSFIGVTFQKGKNITTNIYKKLDDIF